MKISHFPKLYIIVVVLFCVAVDYTHGLYTWRDYSAPSNLRFSAGDVIACRMDFNFWASLYGAEHVYLAVNSSNVAHIWGVDGKDKSENNYGTLYNENFVEMTANYDFERCRIATSQFNEAMADLSVHSKSSYSAVSAAKSDVGRSVYYNLFECNCEHWVTYWKYGKAWSLQSNQGPNSRCSLVNHFIGMSPATSSYYSNDNGNLNTRVNAVVGQSNFGKGIFNGKAVGPNAGANFAVGEDGLGTGFSAGLGEVRANLGTGVGASLGLAADTQIGVGNGRAALQVLGTGFAYSRKDGFKMCFFGSCVYLG